jgi:hypothetical protein
MKKILIALVLALPACSAGIRPSWPDGEAPDAAEGDAVVADAGPDADPPAPDADVDGGLDAGDPPDADPPADADPPDLGHDAGPPVVPCPASAGGSGLCIACDPAGVDTCGGGNVCCGNAVCCHMDACISETGGPIPRTCLDPARPL